MTRLPVIGAFTLAACGGGDPAWTGPDVIGGEFETLPSMVTDDGWLLTLDLREASVEPWIAFWLTTSDLYPQSVNDNVALPMASYNFVGLPAALPAIGDDGFVFTDTVEAIHVMTPMLSRWYDLDVQFGLTTGLALPRAGGLVYGDGVGMVRRHSPAGDVVWDAPIGGVPFGQPVVGPDDETYFYVDAGGTLEIVSLDADGGERFRTPLGASPASAELAFHAGVGLLATTVDAVDGTVHALDPANGDVLWETPMGAPVRQVVVWGSGEVGVLTGADDGEVVILRDRDGEEIGRSEPLGAPSYGTIASDRRLYTGCGGELCAVDRDGNVDERLDTGGETVTGWPIFHDGILVVPIGNATLMWRLGGDLWTARDGWPKTGGDNRGTGRAP